MKEVTLLFFDVFWIILTFLTAISISTYIYKSFKIDYFKD